MALSPPTFALTQLSLLATEQASEVAETTLLLSAAAPAVLARAGLAILNLVVASQRTGLGGRSVLELVLDSAVTDRTEGKGRAGSGNGSKLPEHGIRTGDIVRVGELGRGGARKKDVAEMKGKGLEGVVTRVGERAVWLALGDGDGDSGELGEGRLWV